MANLIPKNINEWMRRVEFKQNDLTRRLSKLIPGDIADGVNLDGYMSSGRFRRLSSTGPTTALGYPFNGAAGTLEVYWDPEFGQVQQVFYDRLGSVWSRWWNGASWSGWASADNSGMPGIASTAVAATQVVVSGTLAVLPTTVVATLALTPGTYLVTASISALMGSTTSFAPNSSASLRYWLSGALVFQPGMNTAGIGGDNEPIANSGGTLQRTHQVSVTSNTNLVITAMGVAHTGAGVTVRDVTVQLVALRRN